MIDRPFGDDADLIIEGRWPAAYDEDKLGAAAAHHSDHAATVTNDVHPNLQAAHTETSANNAGALAGESTLQLLTHLDANEDSATRHNACATEIEAFRQVVVDTKTRIIGAVDTFTAKWAKAGELAERNNWYQQHYNEYRTQLINDGRNTVSGALNDLTTAHEKCQRTLHTALDA